MAEESEKKESGFVFQPTYYTTAAKFPTKDFEKFLMFLIKYGLFGEEPDFSTISKGVRLAAETCFIQVRASIDSGKRRYSAAVKNGKMGGRPKKNQNEVSEEAVEEGKNQTKNQNKNQSKNQNRNQTKNQSKNQNQNLNKNKNMLGYTTYNLSISSPPSGDTTVSPPVEPIKNIGAELEARIRAGREKREAMEQNRLEKLDEDRRAELERREEIKRRLEAGHGGLES